MKYRIILFTLLFAFAGGLSAKELHVDKEQSNLVKFISKAPLENFEGKTDRIDGYVYWEGDDLTNKSEIYFEVDLSTLDTGIGLRNRHMRENYLETEKYRYATFKGKVVKDEPLSESEYGITAEGLISIHGVEQPLRVTGNVSTKEGRYHVKCEFNVALSDFSIKIPKLMFMKIDENMKIVLDFHLQSAEENQ